MDKSCKECIHADVCGVYQLFKRDDTCARTCTKYMCLQMAWNWLNDLRSQGKEVNKDE